jgi:hypothetical protein
VAIFDGAVASPTQSTTVPLVDPLNGQPLPGPTTRYLRSSGAAQIVVGARYAAYLLQQDLGYNATNSSSHPWDVRGCAQYFGWDSNENQSTADVWLATVAFDALPVALASPEEVHYLASYFEDGGNMLMGLGVTPTGRIVNSIVGLPDLKSQLNVVKPDGLFHDIAIAYYWPSRVQEIWIDGVQKVYLDNGSAGALPGPPITNAVVPRYGFQSRLALFYGPNGLTNMGARLSAFQSNGKFRFVLPGAPLPQKLAPALTLYPDINRTFLDIELTVGQATNKTITIRNSGYAPLIVSSITSTWNQFVPNVTSATIAPGGSQAVTLHYSGAPPATDGNIEIRSNDPDTPSIMIPFSAA